MIVTMQDYTITDRAPVLIGYEGENLSRNFTVKTFDDLSGIASIELLIGDVNCGAMTVNDTEITISLDAIMIGRAGYKKAQLIMLDDTGAVIMKSNQFDVLVGASNNPRYYAAGEKVKTLTVSIDGRTRQIILPAGFAVSVNGDVAVDHISFKAPASYGDFDFSSAACRVDWTGVDGTSHTNICTEKDADGNWIWALPTALTRGGEGEISFSVSYVVTDATTGAVTADWNTGLVKFHHLESAKSDDAEEDVEEETTYDRLASAIAAVQSAQASVDDVNAILAGITSATPTVVETVADLNGLDTSKVKLAIVAADGYLYYYDGTAWKSGFAYGGLQEIIAARTDSDGVTHADLKTRLNTAEAQIKEDLFAQTAEVAQTKEDVSAISEKTDEKIILDNTSFDRATNNTTFSYDAATNTTTVTNTTASRYRCANTPLSFLYGKLIPGETYILSGQATAISGNPVLRISIRGTESGIDSAAVSLDLVSGVSGEVSFVATEYMRYASLFVTYDNTDLSSASYKDVYIKSEAEGVTAVDVIAREDIKDIREQISTLDITNQWNGKVWYAYGTSITHNTVASGKYVGYLSEMGGFAEAVRKGIPGQGIGNLGDYSTGQVYDAICNTTDGKLAADLITIETGANDLGHVTVPLGTVYDTGKTTLAGCLNDCLRYLQANTNAQVVVFFSPATTFAPTANYQFYDWQEMVRRICDINRVHYINVNCNLGYGKLTSGKGSLYVRDSIHQTDLGAYIYAENIWMQLKSIPIFRTALPT